MKKFFTRLSVIAVVSVVLLGSCKGVALATPSEGAVPQSDDLCGGTGGNGQVESIGNNEFIMKRNDDGSSQVVHLSNQAIIKTTVGLATLSDLKQGMSVTLVGGPNRDGSFTADAVFVCTVTQRGAIQESGISPASSLNVEKKNTKYTKASILITLITLILVGLIWLVLVSYLRQKKKKSFVYLLYFSIFYIYMYKVVDYTLLQFQSLLLLQYFVPNLLLNGIPVGKTVNLIPLATLTMEDVKTSLLNIIMMIPFGFGLPFITKFHMKSALVLGLLISVAIELLQFITGLVSNTTFRIADINDLIFNTVGVAVGYILFVRFVRTYRHIFNSRKISASPILRYIAERPQLDEK